MRRRQFSMRWVPALVRIAFTVTLLYFVYLETGVATTLAFALIAITAEVEAMLRNGA